MANEQNIHFFLLAFGQLCEMSATYSQRLMCTRSMSHYDKSHIVVLLESRVYVLSLSWKCGHLWTAIVSARLPACLVILGSFSPEVDSVSLPALAVTSVLKLVPWNVLRKNGGQYDIDHNTHQVPTYLYKYQISNTYSGCLQDWFQPLLPSPYKRICWSTSNLLESLRCGCFTNVHGFKRVPVSTGYQEMFWELRTVQVILTTSARPSGTMVSAVTILACWCHMFMQRAGYLQSRLPSLEC